MAASMALTIMGSLDIYQGHPKPHSLQHWKTGTALAVLAWAFQVFWAFFSLLSNTGGKGLPGYQGGTAVCIPIHILHFLFIYHITDDISLLASPRSGRRTSIYRNPCHVQPCCGLYATQRSQSSLWEDRYPSYSHVSPGGPCDSRNDYSGPSHEEAEGDQIHRYLLTNTTELLIRCVSYLVQANLFKCS
jgi:hypothetical protein